MTNLERAFDAHIKDKDIEDCLCQRTVPGTKVGEHNDFHCVCKIHESYILGFHKAIEVLKLYEQEDAISCLEYWAKHGFTEGGE